MPPRHSGPDRRLKLAQTVLVERNLRASDADRDRAADTLRRNFAEGRLSAEEFDERLGAALAARTVGHLADLVEDLPQDPGGYALPVPVAGSTGSRAGRPSAGRPPARVPTAQIASYLAVSLLCVLIWLVAGRDAGFWPIWVIGPWGIVLLNRGFRGAGRGGPLDGRRRNGPR